MKTIIKKEFLFSEDESRVILTSLEFFIKHNPNHKHIKIYENMAYLIKEVLNS